MTDDWQDAALITVGRTGVSMPSEIRFAELKRLLESNGYALVRISGSHHIFDKPGERPISIPVHHGKVKYVYVRQIRKALEGD